MKCQCDDHSSNSCSWMSHGRGSSTDSTDDDNSIMSRRGDCSTSSEGGRLMQLPPSMMVWSATMVTRAAMEGMREGTGTS